MKLKKLLSLILVCALLCALTGCKASDYKKAVSAMEGGDYTAAAEAFRALGDYKDSADLALSCDYQQAKRLANRDELLAAAELFDTLGSYSDAADRATECRYDYAAGLMKDRSYLPAAEAFEALGSYSDASDRALECRYENALDLLKAENYTDAITAFEALSGYSDSTERLQEAMDGVILQELQGSWTADTIKLGNIAAEKVAMSTSYEPSTMIYLSYLDMSALVVDYELEISAGDADFRLNAEKFAPVPEATKNNLVTGSRAYYEYAFTEEFAKYGYTLEQGIKASGVEDLDALIEKALSMPLEKWVIQTFSLDTLLDIESYSFTTSVTVKDGVIYVGADKADYDGDTLTFALHGGGMDGEKAVFHRS